MKVRFFVVILVITSASCQAQILLKLYNKSSTQQFTYPQQRSNTYTSMVNLQFTNWLQASAAVQWKGKRKNLHHQIAINDWIIQLSDDRQEEIDRVLPDFLFGYKTQMIYLSLSYEAWYNFYKSRNDRHLFYLSSGLIPYVKSLRWIPYISSYFPGSLTSMGLQATLSPAYQFRLTKRLLLDVNVPFVLTNVGVQKFIVNNPSMEHAGKTREFDVTLAPKHYTLRIGLGLTL